MMQHIDPWGVAALVMSASVWLCAPWLICELIADRFKMRRGGR